MKNLENIKIIIAECFAEVIAEEGRRICAYCKKDMGKSSTEQDSHGICKNCFDKEKQAQMLDF